MNLVFGQDIIIGQWIAAQLDVPAETFFRPYTAIGIQDKGIIVGGVLYNNYRCDYFGNPISIEISGASIDKRCALRHIIKPLLAYPFRQLRVKRVQFAIAKPNMVARQFAERLGFTLEGIARKAHYTGKDAAIYAMLWHECEWINERRRRTFPTPGTRSESNGGCPDSKQSTDCTL